MQKLDNANAYRRRKNAQVKWCLIIFLVAAVCLSYLIYRPSKNKVNQANKKPQTQKQQQVSNDDLGALHQEDDIYYATTTYGGFMDLFTTTFGNWQDMAGRPHYQEWDDFASTTNGPQPYDNAGYMVAPDGVPLTKKEYQDYKKRQENKLPQIPPPKDATPPLLISKIKEASKSEEVKDGGASVSDGVKDLIEVLETDTYLKETDPFKLAKIDFLEKYRNPCFKNGKTDQLYCLPSFFISGMPRSGTSDLYLRLSNHPSIVQTTKHSPAWWSKSNDQQISFQQYLTHFKDASKSLQNLAEMEEKEGISTHNSLLFEFNPSIFWKGKVDASKPFMTPVNIKQVLPESKLIVLVRNPVDRLYSDYFHFNSKATPEEFDTFVESSIKAFKDCEQQDSSEQICVHRDLGDDTKPHLETGIYSIFYDEWLKHYNESRILVIPVEDYGNDLYNWIKKICEFLEVPTVSETVLKNLAGDEFNGERNQDRPPMKDSTRKALSDFYKPYNQKLSQTLKDSKFNYSSK